MLSPGFYALITTSGRGLYNSFSRSHSIMDLVILPQSWLMAVPNNARGHHLCKLPIDAFHAIIVNDRVSIPLILPMRSPSKSSRPTFGSPSSIVSLAPSNNLTRISASNLRRQLFEKKIVHHHLFSLSLVDAQNGNRTLVGTIAEETEARKIGF